MLNPQELFAEAFSAAEDQEDFEAPEWIPPGTPDFAEDIAAWSFPDVRERGNVPRDEQATIADLGETLNDAHDDPLVRGVLRDVASRGVDAVAFYVPYSVSPRRWGIYYNELGMLALTVHAAWELASAGSAHHPMSAVRLATWRTVRAHELVHFGCEYAGATFEVARGSGLYRASLSTGNPFRELQEPIATAIEMRASRQRSAPRRESVFREAFGDAWELLPLSHPYDQWHLYATPAQLKAGYAQLS